MKQFKLYPHYFSSLTDTTFSVSDYSELKFGSDRVARKFALELANFLLNEAESLKLLMGGRCVIVPPPCSTVPVAGAIMASRLRQSLNDRLVRMGVPPVEWSRIHRDVHYNYNYSELTAAERQELLTDEGRYLNKEYLAGKQILFVDDVRITGTHEDKIDFLMANHLPDVEYGFVAYACYQGTEAKIEHQLNHARVREFKDVVSLSREPDHIVTTRGIRILLEEHPLRLAALLSSAPDKLVEDAYFAAIVKGYHVHEPFIESFKVLQFAHDYIVQQRAARSSPHFLLHQNPDAYDGKHSQAAHG